MCWLAVTESKFKNLLIQSALEYSWDEIVSMIVDFFKLNSARKLICVEVDTIILVDLKLDKTEPKIMDHGLVRPQPIDVKKLSCS